MVAFNATEPEDTDSAWDLSCDMPWTHLAYILSSNSLGLVFYCLHVALFILFIGFDIGPRVDVSVFLLVSLLAQEISYYAVGIARVS